MQDRIPILVNLLEVILLKASAIFLLIGWNFIFGGITFLFTSIYSIARIKRDVDKYHNGKFWDYIKYIFGRAKKN